MKRRILIEFSADTLPPDFLDQIAGRVYTMNFVDKKECAATLVGDVLKDAERWNWLIDPNVGTDNMDWPLIIRASDEEPIWKSEANKLIDDAMEQS